MKFKTYDIVVVSLMAAMVFVTTYFIKIEIPTPTGVTMLKAGNIVILLCAMLLGSVRGGLAAGIGSMLYDLTDPRFVASAPFTLVFFFMMAFVCGLFTKKSGIQYRILGGAVGAFTYIALYIGKKIIVLMLAGSAFLPALASLSVNIITSTTNAVIAVTFAVILEPTFRKALKRAGVLQKLNI